MSFVNKVVIITGAASGIGAKTAELFASEDASVMLVDKNEIDLKVTEKRCKSFAKIAHHMVSDVADDEDTKRIIEETIKIFGKLDVLVNCAGIIRLGRILDGSILQSYDELINVNFRSIVLLTTHAAPHLIKTKGNIINISSVKAVINDLNHMYDVSKVAVEHFTRGSAFELSPFGVRVNSVRPGPVRTKIRYNANLPLDCESWKAMTSLNRISEPEEIANIILFLASDKAKGITGSVITCDNGLLLKNAVAAFAQGKSF